MFKTLAYGHQVLFGIRHNQFMKVYIVCEITIRNSMFTNASNDIYGCMLYAMIITTLNRRMLNSCNACFVPSRAMKLPKCIIAKISFQQRVPRYNLTQ